MHHWSRRNFLKYGSALALAGGTASIPLVRAGESRLREYQRGGMRYRRLGQTDLFVSALSFGSHTDPAFRKSTKHGGTLTAEGQARRDRQISRALDLGVNMVDTYENAGQWEPMARLVRDRRDRVLVSICRQFPMFVGDNIDRGAKLFGHVDLYRIYVGDGPRVTDKILEDWDILRKAKAAGKVRAIGISTHGEGMMASALEELEGLDYVMFPYNFIHARAEYTDFIPKAMKSHVGLVAIKPLAAGSIVRLDPGAHANSKPENERTQIYRAGSKTLLPAVVSELTKGLKQVPGESLCQAALRFVYSRPFITSAMPGMFQDDEVESNHAALRRHLEDKRLGRAEMDVLHRARRLARLRGRQWLPDHYRWLDEQWLA